MRPMTSAAPVSEKPRPGLRATREFSFERAAVDQAARTVELAFASEAPYERYWGVEILGCKPDQVRLGRLSDGGALLVGHDPADQVGVVESCQVDADGVCRATVRFSRGERGEEIFQDVIDGIRRQVSVGYMIHRVVMESEKDGVGTYRATDWEPYEVSIVSIAADPGVGVGRDLSTPPAPLSERIPDMTGTVPAPAASAPAAPAAPVVDPAAIRTQALAEIQARNSELIALGDKFKQPDLARQAVLEGRDTQWLRDAIMEKMATAPIATRGYVSVSDNFDQKRHGFKHLGEFAHFVRQAAQGQGRIDERLTRAASTYGAESVGPDGGFAVPPEFASEITRPVLEEDSLLAYADAVPVTGNSLTFPKDETTPWGTTGVYAAWESEAATLAQKKPALGSSTLRLKKLAVLVGATDELLADATAMAAYLQSKMREAVAWKVNDAIINGTGAGMPLGILNGGSVVQVAKETGQAADSVVAANVAKMYARVLMGGGQTVWLMNPDVFPQVITLSLNSNPIWVPANEGFKGAPSGLLLGRPIVLTDACDTVGDVGDLILANMGGYRAITKAGGEDFQTSMHLWFDQGVEAFRLTFRMDGQPVLSSAITPPNSSVTRSHFATIAART